MPVVSFRRVLVSGLLAALVVGPSPVVLGEEATHKQSKEIVIKGELGESLQTFCLGPDGKIFAVVAKAVVYGADEATRVSAGGEVRVLDADGKKLASWTTKFTPQRIAASPAGEVIVGGDGRLARFTPEGKLIAQSESPHLASVMSDPESLRKAAEEQHRSSVESYTEQVKQFDDQIKELKARLEKRKEAEKQKKAENPDAGAKKPDATSTTKPARTSSGFFGLFRGDDAETTTTTVSVASNEGEIAFGNNDENQLRMLEQMSSTYRRMLATEEKKSIDDIIRQITLRLQKIHGIAAGKNEIFVATAMSKGYGYAVWRMTADFQDAKQVVSGLSGCCGQIDIQCDGEKLFVAENSRHRVVEYDRDGKRVDSWGKRDRDGEGGGFGGCCNPMNLTFLADGAVLTSESEGFVKRFSKSGDFLGLVGKAQVSGGCKNVAIGASSDGSRVYFYDLQGSKIIVLSAAQ
jgi:hypothetical protein